MRHFLNDTMYLSRMWRHRDDTQCLSHLVSRHITQADLQRINGVLSVCTPKSVEDMRNATIDYEDKVDEIAPLIRAFRAGPTCRSDLSHLIPSEDLNHPEPMPDLPARLRRMDTQLGRSTESHLSPTIQRPHPQMPNMSHSDEASPVHRPCVHRQPSDTYVAPRPADTSRPLKAHDILLFDPAEIDVHFFIRRLQILAQSEGAARVLTSPAILP